MPELKNILFLDIETAPATAAFSEMNSELARLWAEKVEQMKRRVPERYTDDSTAESMFRESGIFAEFGRIVCVSVGFVFEAEGELHLKEKSFYGEDERQLLVEFASLLNKSYSSPCHYLCGHNAKEFDFPYIARRMVIHGIPVPEILSVSGKKPWEMRFLDTMDMWRFGDYKHYTSLKLLCAVLGVPTPKDDIDGSEVGHVFYEEKNLERIAVYCEKDVLATLQVYLRMTGRKMILQNNVERSV